MLSELSDFAIRKVTAPERFARQGLDGMAALTNVRRWVVYLIVVIATTIAHVTVIALHPKTTMASNAIQLFCAFLAIALTLRRASQTSEVYLRRAWLQLAAAFTIWFGAQAFYLFSLVRFGEPPQFPSTGDFLWLMFSFPILLVTLRRRTRAQWEWVNWLDSAQACTFFTLLYLLIFSRPAILTVTGAYDVQSIALLLACALRFSSTPPGAERTFFRNLGAYLLTYGVLSSVGNRMEGSVWTDLCWSTPLLLFCLMVVLTQKSELPEAPRDRYLKIGMPTHLQGLSALGLALLTIAAATLLQGQRPKTGLLALVISLVLFAVRTSARESQLNGAHESLRHAACHDALTGLANRKFLLERLADKLQQPGISGGEIGLLFIDLDGFKNINDSLGHPFGDRLLVEIAAILCAAVAPNDLVVRLGGDEFVVLTDGADQVSPERLAAALVERLRQPLFLEGRLLYLSASIGIARGVPGQHPDDLVRDADCAMYEAKRLGKNQEQSFRQDMVSKASEQLALEQDLRQAIAANELVCYYQPIYSVSAQAIVGFEALSRWNHAKRGSVSPAEFIPVAEETGLIIELGKRVLQQACEQVQRWNQTYGCRFTMSVNFCARQFADPELMNSIRAVLASTGLDPSLLKIEITESALLSGLDRVETALNAARELGIQISLDDFGTGYSSLSYLLRLPFDVIKIDRSFVQALDRDPKRAELVRTILVLAAGLEKDVIAEGVETEEERDWLSNMHCDLLQGFYFAKPLPAGDIAGLIDAQATHPMGSARCAEHMLAGEIIDQRGALQIEVGAGEASGRPFSHTRAEVVGYFHQV